MILIRRNIKRFCRVEAYLNRFKQLQEAVNRQEEQILSKKAQLEQIQRLSVMTNQDQIYKILSFFVNKTFQSQAVQKQKQRYKKMLEQLQNLKEDGSKRVQISKRLVEQERLSQQNKFLTDLAKFSYKYTKIANYSQFHKDLQVGIELSAKHLQSQLAKQGVEYLGEENQEYSRQIHEHFEGTGDKVQSVIEPGIKIKGAIIRKAKVNLKKE